jgi:integrase
MPKRASNEGSIFQRADGRWVAQVTEIHEGKRRLVSRYAPTQGEARKKLTALKQRQDAGQKVVFGKMTLREWLDYWLDNHVKPNRSPATYASYHGTLKLHVPDDLGRLLLDKVTPEHLQSLFTSIAAKKARTADLLRSILRASFNAALKLRRVPENPARLTDAVRFRPNIGKPLSADQARRLIEVSKLNEDRFADAWVVMISLGLRRGELAGLKPADVDLGAGVVHIRRSLGRLKMPGEKHGRWIEKETKTQGSERSLALPKIASEALCRQMERRAKDAPRCEYLFFTETGGPVHGGVLTDSLQKACDAAKVPRVRVHDLRHSCGTFLGSQGVALTVIMSILGHTQTATAKRYIHTTAEVQAASLAKVADVLNPPPPPDAEKDASNPVTVSVTVN